MKSISAIWLFGSLVFLGNGCSTRTISVPQLQVQSADTYEHHAEIGGLVIGVHPMTDKAEIKRTFSMNVLDKGLLPILVVAENRNPSASFIVTKEKVFILNEITGATNTSQRKEVTSAQSSTGTTLAFVFAGGLVGRYGMKMAADAMVIEYGLSDKEFYSRTLSPGQKAQGFLYFHFPTSALHPTSPPNPDAAPPPGDYHVVAQVKNTATQEETAFDFKVNLDLAKP